MFTRGPPASTGTPPNLDILAKVPSRKNNSASFHRHAPAGGGPAHLDQGRLKRTGLRLPPPASLQSATLNTETHAQALKPHMPGTV